MQIISGPTQSSQLLPDVPDSPPNFLFFFLIIIIISSLFPPPSSSSFSISHFYIAIIHWNMR